MSIFLLPCEIFNDIIGICIFRCIYKTTYDRERIFWCNVEIIKKLYLLSKEFTGRLNINSQWLCPLTNLLKTQCVPPEYLVHDSKLEILIYSSSKLYYKSDEKPDSKEQ